MNGCALPAGRFSPSQCQYFSRTRVCQVQPLARVSHWRTFCAVVVLLATYLLWRIAHSPFGRVLEAIRDNEQRARCLGYDTRRYKLVAFVLSLAFMGLAGSLLSFLIEGVYANIMSWQYAGDPVLMTILAGLGHDDRERIGAVVRRLIGRHSILLIEHDIDRVLSLSDRITVLHQGRVIAEGTPQAVVNQPEVVMAYLGRREATRPPIPAAARAPRGRAKGPILTLKDVTSGYAGSRVLRDVSLEVGEGEVVALLGRNGLGKTATLRTIMGTVKPMAGSIELAGQPIGGRAPHRINCLGVSVVAEGRRIFPNLSLLNNLQLARRPGGWSVGEVFALFPRLGTLQGSKGESLSGGELQMLAIALALMALTKLIPLGEPLEGLAPAVVNEVVGAIAKLQGRTSILIVEQKIDLVLQMADRAYVMVNGQLAHAGDAETLRRHEGPQVRLLGV